MQPAAKESDMSILICKQCKGRYDTSWGHHNDDYCISSCHIESLEAELAAIKKTIQDKYRNANDAFGLNLGGGK